MQGVYRERVRVVRRKAWQFIGKRKGERWKEEELSRRCYSKVLIRFLNVLGKVGFYLSSKIIQL